MPTIIREHGFSIRIYFKDHHPPHVHAIKAGKQARITLDPVAVIDSEFSPQDTRQVLAIVTRHRTLLQEKWSEIYD